MLVTALDSPTTDQATTTVRTIETSPEWHVLWSRLVLSVDLMSRSVAVEVDCTLAVPV